MAIDRFVAPAEQFRYIDPYQQRVFQYGTEDSDVFLARVVNSLYKIFGNNIVITGFDKDDFQMVTTDDEIYITVPAGMLIQDNTLVEFNEKTQLMLENVSTMSMTGRIIAYVRYQYLQTIEQNQAYLCLNYISSAGTPRYSWDSEKDLTLLGIFEFEKDNDDNVIGVTLSDETVINIVGQDYHVFGLSDDNLNLKKYLLQMVKNRYGSSIEIDSGGLALENDVNAPGTYKYYGTDDTGQRGWYSYPPEDVGTGVSFLDLEDTPNEYGSSLGQFLYVDVNGDGLSTVDIDSVLGPKVVTIDDDQLIQSNKVLDGNLTILKDLIVRGDVTNVESSILSVENPEIVLNLGETGDGVSLNYSGLRVKRGTLQDALLRFSEVRDRWVINLDGSEPQNLLIMDDLNPILTQINQDIIDARRIMDTDRGSAYEMTLENGNLVFTEL